MDANDVIRILEICGQEGGTECHPECPLYLYRTKGCTGMVMPEAARYLQSALEKLAQTALTLQDEREAHERTKKELRAAMAYKAYFDGMGGDGLAIAGYHLNGECEPFDTFLYGATEAYNGIMHGEEAG